MIFADKHVPLFSLVDDAGNVVRDQQLRLLLYRGIPVHNSFFDDTTADAVCRQMNFSSALEWRTGSEYDIQDRYQSGITIRCSVADWEPKKCIIGENSWAEDDGEDVFLSCTG